jgi:double-stranded uracil-DNA glycosylase
VLGIGAYRTAFGAVDAVVGEQPARVGTTRIWLLPNPSGLNAHWPTPRLVEAFRELRDAALARTR